MFYKALLYPVLVQVALTFFVMMRMYLQRVAEFQRKNIHPQKAATRVKSRELLTDSAASADNFSNLFEMPVLFFVAMLLAITLLLQDPVLATMAWLYVGLRIAHSMVHITYNTVMHRFYLFALSAFTLFLIWVRLGWLIFIH